MTDFGLIGDKICWSNKEQPVLLLRFIRLIFIDSFKSNVLMQHKKQMKKNDGIIFATHFFFTQEAFIKPLRFFSKVSREKTERVAFPLFCFLFFSGKGIYLTTLWQTRKSFYEVVSLSISQFSLFLRLLKSRRLNHKLIDYFFLGLAQRQQL